MEKDYKKQILNSAVFPEYNYTASCLIYSKRQYGLFLLRHRNGDYYVAKVVDTGDTQESEIGLFIKDNIGNFPNILVPETIYVGNNPNKYELFSNPVNLNPDSCKSEDINKIFVAYKYIYYITKSCSFNFPKFFAMKNELSYYQFTGFTLQLLLALQTLYKIGIRHGDLAGRNILVCDKNPDSETVYQLRNNIFLMTNDQMRYKELKLTDFGESRYATYKNPCFENANEIKFQGVDTIKLFWKNTIGKDDDNYYNELMNNLNNCSTNLYDVIQRSRIFDIFIVDRVPIGSNIVKLIE